MRQIDLEWLSASFPDLHYDPEARVIEGQLQLSAAYNRAQGKLRIGSDDATLSMDSYLCDSFSIRIELDALDHNGWPTVYEVGDRYETIAQKENVQTIDLHVYPDGACCLGLKLLDGRQPTFREFMDELVVPFFYRLSYTEIRGLEAARQCLWGELSHGNQGVREYLLDIAEMARQDLGRNNPCACGSGRKFKRCHLGEVERFKLL